jgi:predicted nucleic acid-binding Zn ribbon protein
MSAIRKAASRWLSAAIRHLPAPSQEWANAMLREMDFVEGDWPALWWVVGSGAVLCGYSIALELRALNARCRKQLSAERMASRMFPMLAGAGAALIFLGVCIAVFSSLLHAAWFNPVQHKLADRLLIVVIPETAYLAGTLALWRRRRTFAVGILGAGVLLMAHAIAHFAAHV